MKKILVVDDEPVIVKSLSARLVQEGYSVLAAADGAGAIAKASAEKPDLIILDLLLPKMTGDEVAAVIRQDESMKNIPIVFLTALKTRDEEETQGFKIGDEHVFAKPFDHVELLKTIQQLTA